MILNKKADLGVTTIVVIVISLLVLVVIVYAFMNSSSSVREHAACAAENGICIDTASFSCSNELGSGDLCPGNQRCCAAHNVRRVQSSTP